MDWLSNQKAVIVCYEKIVRIPVEEGKVLCVQGERNIEKTKKLISTKANELTLSDIPIIRDFEDVFIDDLSRLPPQRQVEFRIDLIPGVTPIDVGFAKEGESICEVLQVRVLVARGTFSWTRGKSRRYSRGPKRFIENFFKIAKPLTLLTQKNQKYEWGEKQEEAFRTLKDNLCNAPILSLSDGLEDFVVYCDTSNQGLGCVLMQRDKVIAYASRQLKSHKKNYTTHDLELGTVVFAIKIWRHYLYGTKSVIYTDHKSLQHIFDQKELNMCQRRWLELFSDYECEIKYHPGKANVVVDALTQGEAFKDENVIAEGLNGVRTKIMDEAHKTRYSVHPEADKMYYDLRDMYWWLGMKKEIVIYVSKFLTCAKVKVEHQRPSVDRLTKSAHFLAIQEDYSMETLARLYIDEIVAQHGVPTSIISDRDGRFTSRFWQTMQKALGTRLDISTAYHPQKDGQSEHTIQTLEDMLRASPVLWAEIGDSGLIGPELVQEITDKVVVIRYRLKAARDRQKSYTDNRRKPLEFQVGDHVMLKVSRFEKKGKLASRFVGPFKILERISHVTYRLRLPEELSSVHNMFHESNLKKCLADAKLHVPLEEIKVDKTLHFVEKPLEIMDREVKTLKRSKIPIVKG
ncbi:putative reverse transcriptase domain-containing protein [Tanacetum coccineum]